MAGQNRWTTRNPDDPKDSGQVDPETDIHCCSWSKPKLKPSDQSINTEQPPRVDPGPDDCCCPCLKPKPDERRDAPKVQRWQGTVDIPKGNSNGSKKPDERSDAPKVQQWQGTVVIPKGNSNGNNKNTWSDNMQPNDSSGVSRGQQVILKNNKYTENDPVETTKNGAVNEFKGKQMWAHDQENSDGIPGNMKPKALKIKNLAAPDRTTNKKKSRKKVRTRAPTPQT
ncbi:hypothetical protein LWI29_023262 [Acer saccharum]|uniref:Uncharacterized protein n=1 Tax=Acer saccharum TaxID=4024 RepID=A0AA39SUP5_ACESA|nr:hypothetical protein LWI29_023262 [Acer saccharum]